MNRKEFSYLGLIPQASGGIRDRRIAEPVHEPFFFGPHGADNAEADGGLPIDKLVKLWM